VIAPAKLPDLNDTIVALSSAAGPGARAIVRLSGRRAASIASQVCPDFDPARSRSGHFISAPLRLPPFYSAISADVYHFVGPRTYTGQDVVEIHLISCAPIIDALIAVCLDAGARSAQPGEFTMRAFLAGKLDLTRAEAVLGVIEAGDRQELTHALTQLAGGIATPIQQLRDDLLNLLADVEAGLDFTEEDIHFISPDDLLKRLANGLAYLTLLQKQIDRRALSQRPFRVVLAGKPNAGKSSLFNALTGAETALVSAKPGTTRDYLVKRVTIDGITLELVDTAGLRESSDAIETDSQSLAREQTRHADMTLWCTGCDDPDLARTISHHPHEMHIATKSDFGPAPDGMLATSAVTKQGLAELRRQLAQAVCAAPHAGLAPSLSRCKHHVDACLQHLRNAHAIVIDESMPELLALELRLALDALGAMAGMIYTDDLLDRIFSRFCIGK
jgi:tRNA modification GTPase